jgi:hypothetical protein
MPENQRRGLRKHPAVKLLASALADHEGPWRPWQAANTLWAHGVLRHGTNRLLGNVFAAISSLDFPPDLALIIAYAMAQTDTHHPFVARMSEALLGAPAEDPGVPFGGESGVTKGSASLRTGIPTSCYSARDLCLVAWSLASCGGDPAAIDLLVRAALSRGLRSLAPQSLTMLVKAAVGAGALSRDDAVADALCDAVVAGASASPGSDAPSLSPRDAAALLHALATCCQLSLRATGLQQHQDPDWQLAVKRYFEKSPARGAALRSLSSQASRQASSMGLESLTAVAWAAAVLRLRGPALLGAVADRTEALWHRLDSQAVATVAWAYGVMAVDDPRLCGLLCAAATRLLRDRSPFPPQALCTLAYSLAVMDALGARGPVAAAQLLGPLCERASASIDAMGPQELCSLGWALSVAGTYPAQLLRRWRAAVAAAAPGAFAPGELAQLHHVELALRLEAPGLGLEAPARYSELLEGLYRSGRAKALARGEWAAQADGADGRRPSGLHAQVAASLAALGYQNVESEYVDSEAGYSIDLAVPLLRVAVEADGVRITVGSC